MVISSQNSHDKVRKRALSMILIWTTEFENDESLGVMADCYNSLKGKGAGSAFLFGLRADVGYRIQIRSTSGTSSPYRR